VLEKLPSSSRYRLPAQGYSLCLIFPAPLTAGLLNPIPADAIFVAAKRSRLDRLNHNLVDDLNKLVRALGFTFSSPLSENKILVEAPITASPPRAVFRTLPSGCARSVMIGRWTTQQGVQ
jgi:hypothetical protein